MLQRNLLIWLIKEYILQNYGKSNIRNMSVKVELFGFMPNDRDAKLIFRLKSGQGYEHTKKEQIKTLIEHL